MKCNSRDVFTLAEAVATNAQGQCPYEPRQGCLITTRELVCRLIRNDLGALSYHLTKMTARR